MVYDKKTKELNFDDDSLTANMRAAYPMHYISNSSVSGMASKPNHMVLLTCDAFGVMPPLAKLTPAQAMYHFLSGFTSKAAGTERGVREPEPTFSTCFGAPFLPRLPEIYGKLLRDKIAKGGTTCWLVNTGWTGGGYGEGSRIPIKVTRALLSAAINNRLDQAEFVKDANFGFSVPKAVPDVDQSYLNPRGTWKDVGAYDEAAKRLVNLFMENFEQHIHNVDDDVRSALST